jgi:hypothetical protein
MCAQVFADVHLNYVWGYFCIRCMLMCIFIYGIVMNDGVKRQEVKEIKLLGDTRFNVENPLNTRGKNHGR